MLRVEVRCWPQNQPSDARNGMIRIPGGTFRMSQITCFTPARCEFPLCDGWTCATGRQAVPAGAKR